LPPTNLAVTTDKTPVNLAPTGRLSQIVADGL
jgi:hypothetical protein